MTIGANEKISIQKLSRLKLNLKYLNTDYTDLIAEIIS